MKKVIATDRLPIKLWLDDPDSDTLVQAEHLALLECTVGHIVLMPDAHVGYGMPIGGVMATRDMVVPNAVGVDIGCGVCAVRTDLRHLAPSRIKAVLTAMRKRIPLGFRHHRRPQPRELMPEPPRELPVVLDQFEAATRQLGTLGGGNHFIELQQGDDQRIWIMVHSGSRNLGHKVASHYNRLAEDLNKRLGYPVPRSWQLAPLPVESDEGQAYLAEMDYCVRFALANRKLMLERVMEILADEAGAGTFSDLINRSHNFAAWEVLNGERLLVHRKGATRAGLDEPGLIPGSQGSFSYIVRGLGNPEAFYSCSHGAGRRLGRKQARRVLDLAGEKERLRRMGVVHALRCKGDLDEAPGAYKDIEQVMANQADLVEVVTRLRPLAVVKG